MQTVYPLRAGGYYHIFDRGVNRENIFIEERNYAYFLSLYALHIHPVAETYAYCLLRNHFHILVKINPVPEISSSPPSKAFNNFLTAYAKGFNKTYNRTGALFQHHFSRIPIFSDQYFSTLVRYIHQNPCKDGFVHDFRDWPFSSYHELASKAYTQLARPTVLDWFGNANGFHKSHSKPIREVDFREIIGNDMD
jgi:putative transposase